jgi:hypothetical protein
VPSVRPAPHAPQARATSPWRTQATRLRRSDINLVLDLHRLASLDLALDSEVCLSAAMQIPSTRLSPTPTANLHHMRRWRPATLSNNGCSKECKGVKAQRGTRTLRSGSFEPRSHVHTSSFQEDFRGLLQ